MHGSQADETNESSCKTLLPKRSSSLKSTQLIPRQQRDRSLMNPIAQNSQTPNGRISSLGERSISMPSSEDNSQPPIMMPKWRSSENLKSLLEWLNPPNSLRTEETGPYPGIGQLGQQSLLSLTGCKNSRATGSTSSTYSPSLTPRSTVESSPLTRQSERGSGVSGTSNSGISRNTLISKSRTWTRLGYRSSLGHLKRMVDERGRRAKKARKTNPAITGMMGNATKWKRTAEDYMSATNATRLDIRERSAERSELVPKQPKYWQRLVWTDMEMGTYLSSTASFTLYDKPLP